MARPGPKLQLVSDFVRERQRATAREVAHGLQLSVSDACKQLHRLQHRHELRVIEWAPVVHAKRPVAVYGPADPFAMNPLFSGDWIR